jgi:hypothetical protein
MSVINYFLELKCAGDVLNSIYPFLNPEKEISESMAIIKKIKKILITNPNKYYIFDFCAGNCLTSSLIAHMFKIKHIYAIDKKENKKDNMNRIRNFTYYETDFIKNKLEVIKFIENKTPSIIIGVHACSELSKEIINIYKETNSDYLFLMPCCEGEYLYKYPSFIRNKLSRYDLWCLDLCQSVDGEASIDHQCRSNKNIVIVAKRKEINDETKV